MASMSIHRRIFMRSMEMMKLRFAFTLARCWLGHCQHLLSGLCGGGARSTTPNWMPTGFWPCETSHPHPSPLCASNHECINDCQIQRNNYPQDVRRTGRAQDREPPSYRRFLVEPPVSRWSRGGDQSDKMACPKARQPDQTVARHRVFRASFSRSRCPHLAERFRSRP